MSKARNNVKEVVQKENKNVSNADNVSSKQNMNVQFGSVNYEFSRPKLAAVRVPWSAPRRLWADRVEDDEESLPSPLAASAPPLARAPSPAS